MSLVIKYSWYWNKGLIRKGLIYHKRHSYQFGFKINSLGTLFAFFKLNNALKTAMIKTADILSYDLDPDNKEDIKKYGDYKFKESLHRAGISF